MNQPMIDKPEWALSKREQKGRARVAAGLKVKRRRWPWLVVAVVVVGAIGLGVWHRVELRAAAAAASAIVVPPPTMQLLPSEVTTLKPQTLEQTVQVTGSLAPGQQTQLSSQVGGRIKLVDVQPGDGVTKGQVLVQIDVETLQNQLQQQRDTAAATRAQLIQAQKQLERTQALADKGLTPRSGLDQAQSSVDALEANLKALESQVSNAEISLQNATVRAPYAGVVSVRSVEPGQSITAGAPLLTIVNLDTMVAETTTAASGSAGIAKGQKAELHIEGFSGKTFTGTVDRINPVALEGTRTIPVYINVANKGGQLRGGMFVTGGVVVAQRADALAVPPGAVRTDNKGSYVLKITDGKAVRQAIATGQTWNSGQLVGVTSGLAAGDVVVTAPLSELTPDAKVALVGN